MKWFLILAIVIAAIFLGKYLYFKPKFVHGEKAPAFSVSMENGPAFALSDLKGKYVLIDFWGSWCGPCRQENPALVQLYRDFNKAKFKDATGFEIVSIGLEMKQENWLRAIERDGLMWPYHYAEFDRMNNSIGKMYGVREIPTKYLVNPDGYIMGVNQPIEAVAALLREKQVN